MPRKVLCVCQRGNVRSVALAYLLKDEHGRDAVAIGWQTAGPELQEVLHCWADVVVVMEAQFLDRVPAWWRAKTVVCEVGPDVFGNPRHPTLLDKCRKWLATKPI